MNQTKTALARRLPESGARDADALLDAFLAYVEQDLQLGLYPAQEDAIIELLSGKSVILNTPTGSGKSLVALAVHFEALARGETSVYTAPIKALVSEKFFSLCGEVGAEHVGMMTGDTTINRDAPILCCTAEILANIALREGSRAPFDHVIMDEFHFYSDPDRGVAWQIPLLTLSNARFLLMSATLGDASTFVERIEGRTGRPCVWVRSVDRPVPLDFEYRETPLHETVQDLLEQGQDPIYIVHFSQREACEQAQRLMSFDVLSRVQKTHIKAATAGFRFDSPFGKDLRRFVHHGIGVHHAGLLPKYRLLVEHLAQSGQLRLICGTDTLGVGVNVPIRTVLFTALCKYDGQKTALLRVRDFHQIAGRAGRKGFDDRGTVIAQAPEHVIENNVLRQKAAGDPKKMRKLRLKKPPERGYVHWDQAVFERIIASAPEPLGSRFRVDHAMLLHVLGRGQDGCRAMKTLIRESHSSRREQRAHGRHAIQLLRSLIDARVVELGADGAVVSDELQSDFSLNNALSLYLVDAVEKLDDADPEYSLNVLSLVEAIAEHPRAILRRQVDVLRTRALRELKAAGVEYDERIAELDRIEYPKPNAEWIYETFNDFSANKPWIGENIRPKSIARDLYELGIGFRGYVKEYGLARSEGVLLRYLSDVYKALVGNVPEARKTDDVYGLCDWLGAVIRQMDASLLDEWERLRSGETRSGDVALEADSAHGETADAARVTHSVKHFKVLVRNAVWRLVQALASRDYRELEHSVVSGDGAPLWSAERLERAMDKYWAEYESIRTDPQARGTDYFELRVNGSWRVHQTLCDPDAHADWQLVLDVDLAASDDVAAPVLVLKFLGPLDDLNAG